MEYTRVSLLKAALHEIVKSQPGHEDQVLSDAETELEPKQLRYIETRVRGALAGYARPMMESEGLSETSDHLREYFQNDALFVSVSRALATKLQGVQPRISPPGIFLFASASIGQAPAVVIAKLEHENGVRANRRRLADGRTTYIVQLLNDLLFTSASRIFKVGVFPAVTVGESVYGWVVDNQALGANVAHYFMSQFLGLELAIRPDVQTQRFFDLAEGWINSVQDPSKRANYQIALLAEMQSPKTSTSVTNFAEQFLELDDRDSFENYYECERRELSAF